MMIVLGVPLDTMTITIIMIIIVSLQAICGTERPVAREAETR